MDKFNCTKCGTILKVDRQDRYYCPKHPSKKYEFYELVEIEYKPDDEPDPNPVIAGHPHDPACQCDLCTYDGNLIPHPSEY